MQPVAHALIIETLKTMARVERTIATLYSLCAEGTEESRAFWRHLVQEELGHAAAVQRMADIVAERPDQFQPNRAFTVAAVHTILTYVESLIQRVGSTALPRTDQHHLLCLARDMEQSLLESKAGEIVKTTDEGFLSLSRTIVTESVEHKRAIIRRLAATPKSS